MEEFSKKMEIEKKQLDLMIKKYSQQIQIRKVSDTVSVDDDMIGPARFKPSNVNDGSLFDNNISVIETSQRARTRRDGKQSRVHSTDSINESPVIEDVDA